MDTIDYEIESVKKIDIQDGDVLVISIKGHLPIEKKEEIKRNFEDSFLPKKVAVKVVNADLVDIQVLRANG